MGEKKKIIVKKKLIGSKKENEMKEEELYMEDIDGEVKGEKGIMKNIGEIKKILEGKSIKNKIGKGREIRVIIKGMEEEIREVKVDFRCIVMERRRKMKKEDIGMV